MICCKITADLQFVRDNFKNLMGFLGEYGDVLWDNNYLYFANVQDVKITEKTINKVLKKCGCQRFFIEIFENTDGLRETDFANHWIEDKVIKITYNNFEINHKEEIHKMNEQLLSLQKDIELLQNKINTENS